MGAIEADLLRLPTSACQARDVDPQTKKHAAPPTGAACSTDALKHADHALRRETEELNLS